MQKIRKGDKVVVLAGKDKGRTGEVLAVMPKEDTRARARRQPGPRHQKQTAVPGGRDHHQGSADPAVEHRARRPQGWQADPRRLQVPEGRQEGARRQALGRSHQWLRLTKPKAEAQSKAQNTPRLKQVYNETIRKALQEQFGYENEMQVPRIDKIVLNMGVGEATGDSQEAFGRC